MELIEIEFILICFIILYYIILFYFTVLRNQLRKKVAVIAKENYCKLQNIKSNQLEVRLEVAKHCR